jgi:hypothetical protein
LWAQAGAGNGRGEPKKGLRLMGTKLCLNTLAGCDNPASVVAKLFYDLGWWKPEAAAS